jgi:serine phosphatase RsbU (regulator of sigma subunit)/anti-sigma regulatory factor (Ser/Thr protein kinase)
VTHAIDALLPQLSAAWQNASGAPLFAWSAASPPEVPDLVAKAARHSNGRFSQVACPGQNWLAARLLPGPYYLACPIPSNLPHQGGLQLLEVILALLDQLLADQESTRQLSEELLETRARLDGLLRSAPLSHSPAGTDRQFDHDLNIAAQIQASLLPAQFPAVPGLEVAASLKPAYRVGGDFYDLQPTAGSGYALMVGDVAGKGISAALVAALMHATLKSEAQHHSQPAELLAVINRLLYTELDRSETFVTAFLALYQTDPLSLAYASAGHTSALLWRSQDERVIEFDSTGLPLGIAPETSFAQHHIDLVPNDVLLLYSDGVTEAENASGKVFGFQALIDLLLAVHPLPAEQQLQSILAALDLHLGQVPLRDDSTLLLARVAPRPSPAQHLIPLVASAEMRSIRALTLQARQAAAGLAYPSPAERTAFLTELELAVSEIVTNIIVHAYREQPYPARLQGRIAVSADRVQIDLIDTGLDFDPASVSTPPFSAADPPTSGYGLVLARQLLDVCQYTRLPGGRNHWHLEKRLPRLAAPAGVLPVLRSLA